MRPSGSKFCHPHHVESSCNCARSNLVSAQAEGNIALHGHVRKETPILKDHADAAFFRRQSPAVTAESLTVNRDDTAIFPLEASDDSQQRSFPTAAWPQQHSLGTGWHAQCHVTNRSSRSETLANAGKRESGLFLTDVSALLE